MKNYKTFKKWKKKGYSIIRGERSSKRNKKGKPLFHLNQVIYTRFPKEEAVGYSDTSGAWDNPNRFMPAQCYED